MSSVHLLWGRKRKTTKVQDQGLWSPFLTPLIDSRYRVLKDGLDTVTRHKSREGFVFTNMLPKVSRIELKHINSNQYEQITGPSHSEGTEIQAWRKRRGRNYGGWKHHYNPRPPLLPSPALSLTLSFFLSTLLLSLLTTANFSLCNKRKTFDLYKSICLGFRSGSRTGLPAFLFLSPTCARCVC